MKTRRNFLVSCGAAFLSGCSNSPIAHNIASLFSTLGQRYRFSLAQVQSSPYASIGVSIDDTPQSMLVLARNEGDDLHWFSADKAVLVTRYGRIIRTVGLVQANIAHTTLIDRDPLTPNATNQDHWKQQQKWQRSIDIQPMEIYGMLLSAEWIPMGEEEIETINGKVRTYKVKEVVEVRNRKINKIFNQTDSFTNYFWLNAENGQVIASQQYIAPQLPSIYTETLKPYR